MKIKVWLAIMNEKNIMFVLSGQRPHFIIWGGLDSTSYIYYTLHSQPAPHNLDLDKSPQRSLELSSEAPHW